MCVNENQHAGFVMSIPYDKDKLNLGQQQIFSGQQLSDQVISI
jgi:hypothetical protein